MSTTFSVLRAALWSICSLKIAGMGSDPKTDTNSHTPPEKWHLCIEELCVNPPTPQTHTHTHRNAGFLPAMKNSQLPLAIVEVLFFFCVMQFYFFFYNFFYNIVYYIIYIYNTQWQIVNWRKNKSWWAVGVWVSGSQGFTWGDSRMWWTSVTATLCFAAVAWLTNR